MFLIRNLSQVATPVGTAGVRGAAMRSLRVIQDAAVVIDGSRFAWIGAENELPRDLKSQVVDELDAKRATSVPGFVD